MTYDYGAPPDVEEVVVAWLSTLGTCSVERPAGDALPYRMVTRVAGADNKIWDSATVSVHTFAATRTAALTAARLTHTKMLSLLPEDAISLPSGGTATVDRVLTDHGPIYTPWNADESVKRYVARYRVDLRFVKVDGS